MLSGEAARGAQAEQRPAARELPARFRLPSCPIRCFLPDLAGQEPELQLAAISYPLCLCGKPGAQPGAKLSGSPLFSVGNSIR
jgi:hypothetical protein